MTETDSGWIGAGPDDDLDRQLAQEGEETDRALPHVMTVLGPIEPGALGVTLVGERIAGRADEPDRTRAWPDDRLATLAEIEDAHAAGVHALLDRDRPGRGRDDAALGWLAGRVRAHLIAVTGPSVARDPAGDPGIVAAAMVAELMGADEAALRAGAIALGPTAGLDDGDAGVAAVAAAHRATGAAVLMQAGGFGDARRMVDALGEAGVAPDRMLIQSLAARTTAGELRSVLGLGVSVAFDATLAGGWEEAARQAAGISDLVKAGFGGRMTLAAGLDRRGALRGYGGDPGWGAVADRFTLLLVESGVDAELVRTLLIDNPRRLLTKRSPGKETG